VYFTTYYFVEHHRLRVDRNVGRTDRLARIGAGTALLGAGAKHGLTSPVRGALEVGVGGVLVATGVSGRCPAYDVVDADTTE
jgi:sulfite exporter TauE/SafE